ncbi:MAG: methylated-DNA--[protein]-cysteine S-methyltransferase [Nitrospirae bacterium]|nr:methylated-DNA--[protein]-cysteine S-methyltransferase [Nitrospirota bacterium]
MLYYDKIDTQSFTIYIIFSEITIHQVTFEKPSIPKGVLSNDITLQFIDYLSGKRKVFEINYVLYGISAFTQKVLDAVNEIPYGQTRSYKCIAETIGNPKSSRAVGQALNKNPLPIIIPCHRVIASDGKISGYAYGEKIKQMLLKIEYSRDLSRGSKTL